MNGLITQWLPACLECSEQCWCWILSGNINGLRLSSSQIQRLELRVIQVKVALQAYCQVYVLFCGPLFWWSVSVRSRFPNSLFQFHLLLIMPLFVAIVEYEFRMCLLYFTLFYLYLYSPVFVVLGQFLFVWFVLFFSVFFESVWIINKTVLGFWISFVCVAADHIITCIYIAKTKNILHYIIFLNADNIAYRDIEPLKVTTREIASLREPYAHQLFCSLSETINAPSSN